MKLISTIELTRENLEDIFVTALEGGSNYWYFITDETLKKIRSVVPKEEDECISTALFKAVYDKGMDVEINDVEDEDNVLGTVSMKTMQTRLQKLMNSHNASDLTIFADEGGDADNADVVFQYIVMEEVAFS